MSEILQQFKLSTLSIIWGSDRVSDAVFSRWSQGFIFSHDEPLALVQLEGGPCAVIAPVQAHIFKNMLLHHSDTWQQLGSREANHLLSVSLCDILGRIADTEPSVRLVRSSSDVTCASAATVTDQRDLQDTLQADDIDLLHSNLRVDIVLVTELLTYIEQNLNLFKSKYGILLFLYSVVETKTEILCETGDDVTSLVDTLHGHGSQCLINLLVTGRAVPHVWDDTKYLSDMVLPGILCQPEIGFLTILEKLHYCTVGSNLKNPLYPVWLIGSEAHISVVFSTERRLTRPISRRQLASRKFDTMDTESAGFIPFNQLANLMSTCELESSSDYLSIMRPSLDPERLGVVLKSTFLDEFYPDSECVTSRDCTNTCPDSFPLYYCNALVKSNANNQVKLRRGDACLLESRLSADSCEDQLLTCLQSRWPQIDIRWQNSVSPSIN